MQGDGANDKLNTPLATLHSFDGWADVFDHTQRRPDRELSVAQRRGAGGARAHRGGGRTDYRSQSASQHYGRELDLLLEYRVLPFDKNLLVGAKFARFVGDDVTLIGGAAVEHVNKFWAYTQYSF